MGVSSPGSLTGLSRRGLALALFAGFSAAWVLHAAASGSVATVPLVLGVGFGVAVAVARVLSAGK